MQGPWLRLIGPPTWFVEGSELRFADERPFQLMSLLAYRGEWLPRERLAALFWPGHAADAARRNLRKVLFRLRELPGLPEPEESAGALRWVVDTDVRHLEAALGRGDTAAVAAAWPLQPFDGLEGESGFAEWLRFERQRLRSRWRQALLSGIDQSAQGADALGWARLLREQDPLDEDALRAELQALMAAGRLAEARQVYEGFEADLARELATRPDARTRAIGADLKSDRMTAHAGLLATAEAGATPTVPTGAEIIGRDAELRQIQQRFAGGERRWITLLGPGGIGKTRLARAVAASAPPGRAAWVDAQDLLQAEALLPRVAQALSLGAAAQQEPGLIQALQGRALLLVLDNLEQIDDLVPLANRLLHALPGLQVLATSRRRMGVAGEVVIELAGLPFPEAEDHEQALQFDAVRLFVQAVERHRGDFDPAAERDAVAALCRAVEGWPLALELCAAWTPQLSVREILQRLQQGGAEVLRTPASADGRHDSLLHILELSWQRLAVQEQAALARLTLLDEPCGTELASAVAGVSVLQLAGLADRAWLRRERRPGAADRWGLHALVHRFLAQQRAGRPDWSEAGLEALCSEIAQRCQRVPPARDVAAHAQALDELGPELPALTRAWSLGVAAWRADRLDLMHLPMSRLLMLRQAWHEGVALLQSALPLLQGAARGRLLSQLSLLRLHGGQLAASLDDAREALRALRRSNDTAGVLGAQFALGQGLLRAGQWDAAARVLGQGVATARSHGDVQAEWQLLDMASGVPYARGQHDQQVALLEQGIALALAHDFKPVISYSNLGNAYRSLGRLADAEAAFRRGLSLAVGTRWRRERATLLLNFGLMAGQRNQAGDFVLALSLAQEGLQAAGQGVDVRIELYLLGLLAGLKAQAQEFATAREALCKALAGARRLNLSQVQLWLLQEWAQWFALSGRLDEALGVLGTVLADPALPAHDAARCRDLRQQWGLDPDTADPREALGRHASVESLVNHLLASA